MCCSMSAVEIPEDTISEDKEEAEECKDSCQFSDLHDQLLNKFNIEVPIFTFEKKRYARISCHIYNEVQDYLKLAEAILKIYKARSAFFEKLAKYQNKQN
jgi:hypothetical protein